MGILINNMEAPFATVEPLTTIEHQQLPYQLWGLNFFYKFAEGVIGMAVAEEGGTRDSPTPCEIVRECAPTGSLTIRFQVEREGDWPVIPSPEPNSPNLVHSWHELQVVNPNLNSDASKHFFAVGGTYLYIMRRPLWGPTQGLYAGWNPISLTPFFFLKPGQFKPLV